MALNVSPFAIDVMLATMFAKTGVMSDRRATEETTKAVEVNRIVHGGETFGVGFVGEQEMGWILRKESWQAQDPLNTTTRHAHEEILP